MNILELTDFTQGLFQNLSNMEVSNNFLEYPIIIFQIILHCIIGENGSGENFIDRVMVSMLTLSEVDHRFESWLDQINDYKIDICCASPKHVALGVRTKTDRLRVMIMCLSGRTCPPMDSCFSQLAL